MHKSSYDKMESFKETYLDSEDDLRILDIGSFDPSKPPYNHRKMFNNPKWTYEGLDLKAGQNVDIVIKDPYNWEEIEDASYDVIISGQVFEHIEFFWLTMEQIDRVLKPNGFCCIIAPSAGPVHKNPFDCFRFTAKGMKSLAEYVNFIILEFSTNTSEEAKPWYDSVLIARKPSYFNENKITKRIDEIEKKLDLLINKSGN